MMESNSKNQNEIKRVLLRSAMQPYVTHPTNKTDIQSSQTPNQRDVAKNMYQVELWVSCNW